MDEYGTYVIMSAIYISIPVILDLGATGKIIRSEDKYSNSRLANIWTFQMIIACILISIGIIFYLKLDVDEVSSNIFAIVCMGFIGLGFPLIIINQALSEKELRFIQVASIETVSMLVFVITIVSLSLTFNNAWIFFAGFLARTLISVIGYYWINSFRPKFILDFKYSWCVLLNNISFQLGKILSVVKDLATPIIVSSLVGMAALAGINWVQLLSNMPVLLIGAINRVLLPYFSKNKLHKKENIMLEQTIYLGNLTAATGTLLIWLFAAEIDHYFFSDKFINYQEYLKYFLVANLFVPTVGPILAAWDSENKSYKTLLFCAIWLLLNWMGSIIFVPKLGVYGIALTNLIIQITNLYIIISGSKDYGLILWKIIAVPWSVMIIIYLIIKSFSLGNTLSIIDLLTFSITIIFSTAIIGFLAYKKLWGYKK